MKIKEKIIKYIINKERKKRGLPTIDEERLVINKMLKRNYLIPDNKKVVFNNLIVFELIPKEKINNFRIGLIEFVKNFQQYPNPQDIENIESFLNIHNEYINANNYGTLASCNFNNTLYKDIISSIQIIGYDISSSFVCICFNIETSANIKKEFQDILGENCEEIIKYKFSSLRNFFKFWAWGNYMQVIPEVKLRQDKINKYLSKFKRNVLYLIGNYISLTSKEYDVDPLSVEYFDTNINHKEKTRDFWEVFSINGGYGQLSQDGRWAFFMDTSNRCNYKLISNTFKNKKGLSVEAVLKDHISHYLYFLYQVSYLLIFDDYIKKTEKLVINYRKVFINIITSKYSLRMYSRLINAKNKMTRELLLFERIIKEINKDFLKENSVDILYYFGICNKDFIDTLIKSKYSQIVKIEEEFKRVESLTDEYISISSVKVNYNLQLTLLLIAIVTLITGIVIPIITSSNNLK